MPQEILNGIEITDGTVSERSRRALELAVRVARARDARLTVLHCRESVGDAERAQLEGVLETLVSEVVPEAVPVKTGVVQGTPWVELTRSAVELASDVVIVGRSARRPETTGTPLELLRRCPRHVWVVHPEVSSVPTKVLAATDLSAVGDRAVEVGHRIAETFAAELHALHAYSMPAHVQLERGRDPTEAQREIAEIEQRAKEHIEVHAGEAARIHVVCDTPSHAIKTAITSLSIDLLVTGTVSRTGLARWLIGSTAARLVNKVGCSVLALKPDDFPVPDEL